MEHGEWEKGTMDEGKAGVIGVGAGGPEELQAAYWLEEELQAEDELEEALLHGEEALAVQLDVLVLQRGTEWEGGKRKTVLRGFCDSYYLGGIKHKHCGAS